MIQHVQVLRGAKHTHVLVLLAAHEYCSIRRWVAETYGIKLRRTNGDKVRGTWISERRLWSAV